MAALKDFTATPKFFEKRPGYENSYILCEKCRKHKYIIGAKWGCDYVIFSNVSSKHKKEVVNAHIHLWCEVDTPPTCLRAYSLVGPVNADP